MLFSERKSCFTTASHHTTERAERPSLTPGSLTPINHPPRFLSTDPTGICVRTLTSRGFKELAISINVVQFSHRQPGRAKLLREAGFPKDPLHMNNITHHLSDPWRLCFPLSQKHF